MVIHSGMVGCSSEAEVSITTTLAMVLSAAQLHWLVVIVICDQQCPSNQELLECQSSHMEAILHWVGVLELPPQEFPSGKNLLLFAAGSGKKCFVFSTIKGIFLPFFYF